MSAVREKTIDLVGRDLAGYRLGEFYFLSIASLLSGPREMFLASIGENIVVVENVNSLKPLWDRLRALGRRGLPKIYKFLALMEEESRKVYRFPNFADHEPEAEFCFKPEAIAEFCAHENCRPYWSAQTSKFMGYGTVSFPDNW